MNSTKDILDSLQAYVEGIQEEAPQHTDTLHACEHINIAWQLCKHGICDLIIERIQTLKIRIKE
jgi:hypothetical protein